MEACGTSNHWARTAQLHGHEVKLLHAKYVKAYVRRTTPDAADADAHVLAMRLSWRIVMTAYSLYRLNQRNCKPFRGFTGFVNNGNGHVRLESVKPGLCWPSLVSQSLWEPGVLAKS